MSNKVDDALDLLAVTLEPVLPGRVLAFPHLQAPGVSIGLPTLQTAGAGSIEAEFPVTFRYDGDTRAQVAGLNDLVAKAWDACERLRGCIPFDARPVEGADAARSVVMRVRMHIASRTLCQPDVVQSFIPPEPVPV